MSAQRDLFGASIRARSPRPPGTHSPHTGRFLKEQGQATALAHAGPAWTATILDLLREWLAPRKGQLVVMEDFRAQVPLDAHPPSSNAWGSLPRIAVKAGLIKASGHYAKARSPRTHNHPVMLWEVL